MGPCVPFAETREILRPRTIAAVESQLRQSAPRTRGDGPSEQGFTFRTHDCSPHTRGSKFRGRPASRQAPLAFLERADWELRIHVCEERAGVILSLEEPRHMDDRHIAPERRVMLQFGKGQVGSGQDVSVFLPLPRTLPVAMATKVTIDSASAQE